MARERDPMRIEIEGDGSIDSQARTYAEYRLFAALSQVVGIDRVRRAHLALRRVTHAHTGPAVTCTVTVDVGGNELRLRTTGGHPYAAINRAVEQLRHGRSRLRGLRAG